MKAERLFKRILAFFLKVVVPGAVLVAAVFGARKLIETRPQAERAEHTAMAAPMVEVIEVEARAERIDVPAQGDVIPARSVVIVPQVTGRITEHNPNLVPGGLVQAGEDLVEIEQRQYRIALRQARAERERAEAALELEEGRQVVAEREWDMFSQEMPAAARSEGAALALREPQRNQAEAAVSVADAVVDNSALQLERTRIEAPFNAFVQEEHAEIGQVVGPQSQLATLVGTDTFWVQVNLPVEKLAQIYVPGVNGSEGSSARIWQRVGDKRLQREGRVIRLQGALDPVGRQARLLIEIDDPLRLLEPDDEGGDPTRLPLLLGAFVHVEIEGREVEEVVDLPRIALRDGDTVYLLTDDHTLEIRPVEIVWGRDESVLVRGLATGDRVITSNLPAPVEGMALRLPGEEGEEGTGSGVAPDLRAEPDTGGEVEETSTLPGADNEAPPGEGGAMTAPPRVEGEREASVAAASE